MEVAQDGSKRRLKKAAITLTDCLACSGCVTSAESILVEMQTYKVSVCTALSPHARTRMHTPSHANYTFSNLILSILPWH